MYYMVFFYLGFIINSNSIQLSLIDKPLFMIIILVSFFAFFPILYVFKQNTDEIEFVNNPIVERLLVSFLKHLCGMTYSSLGCLMLFSVVRYLYRKKALSCRAVEIGGLGMGIFIIHQFILKMLYWHTDMSLIFGSYVLPWAATFITLIISICFTFCMLQFSLGRLLLGQTKYSYHLK